ncbi:MAG: hypothetical protein JKY17_06505 [Magnetovibrio sp.]|nr:hypothetical protein [Magnetovibrio sp.]
MTKLFILARYDAIRLFGLSTCVWIAEQIISSMVERLIWGEQFVHWFDVAFVIGLFGLYAHIASRMADKITVQFNRNQTSDHKSTKGTQ